MWHQNAVLMPIRTRSDPCFLIGPILLGRKPRLAPCLGMKAVDDQHDGERIYITSKRNPPICHASLSSLLRIKVIILAMVAKKHKHLMFRLQAHSAADLSPCNRLGSRGQAQQLEQFPAQLHYALRRSGNRDPLLCTGASRLGELSRWNDG